MESEDIEKQIERQARHLKEVIEACPLFTKAKGEVWDRCNELCPAYRYCWSLQDQDEKVLKEAQNAIIIDVPEVTNSVTPDAMDVTKTE